MAQHRQGYACCVGHGPPVCKKMVFSICFVTPLDPAEAANQCLLFSSSLKGLLWGRARQEGAGEQGPRPGRAHCTLLRPGFPAQLLPLSHAIHGGYLMEKRVLVIIFEGLSCRIATTFQHWWDPDSFHINSRLPTACRGSSSETTILNTVL